jgi:hypothetical protein
MGLLDWTTVIAMRGLGSSIFWEAVVRSVLDFCSTNFVVELVYKPVGGLFSKFLFDLTTM